MTRRDTPQSERRAALDAAIAALDEQRRKYQTLADSAPLTYLQKYLDKVAKINDSIRILSDMREEGPLL